MKINLYFNRRKPVLFFCILCFCLIILGCSSLLLPPQNSTQPLEVLCLKSETHPVFYIASQLTYTHEDAITWLSELNKAEPSLHSQLEAGAEPSPSSLRESDGGLNLVLNLTTSAPSYDQIASDLLALSEYFSHISLSVQASEPIADKTYLLYYETLYNILQKQGVNSVSLIAYPQQTSQLSLYNQEFISHIGTVLNSQADFETLDKLYTYFSDQKTLVVRDEIKNFFMDSPQTAAKEITASYYLLAIKYPKIQMIFSPYINPPVSSSDSYVLMANDSNFTLFNTIYNRLLSKPWISTSTKTVDNTSPYEKIQDYDTLSSTSELILAPDAAMLKELKGLSSAEYALYFKWNDELLNINLCYPYAISINTLEEPNSLSRLSVTFQDKKNNLHQTYAIDLEIQNPSSMTRASRVESFTEPNTAYTAPKNQYIPILMYHSIEHEVAPEDQNSHVETTVFDSQMNALIKNGYTPINFYDLKNYADGFVSLPEKPIIITMDDGYLNNYTNAYPIYKKYNIQATLFVSPYYMQMENTERHFGWLAAKEMEDSGLIDIQPHGYDHTPLTYLSSKDISYHASLAKGLIEMHLGPRDVSVLAYPQFRHNTRTVKVLDELGYDFQIINLAKRGTVLPTSPSFSPPKLKRINVPNTMSPEELIATLDSFIS
ncbi:MAG: hypothetical protein E7231_08510 [Cellulosilyticum sp.]|nr:hypothetical protein [Cellulosilyticum sp.]